MNETRKQIIKHFIIAALGLMLFAAGTYLTIQADLGVDPWTTLNFGIAKQLGILYGDASIVASLTIIGIDLLLREKIGLGTLLDAVIVGKTVDLINWIDPIPVQNNLMIGMGFLLVGFFIMGLGQYLYMKMALSCGPRDALLVALGRRIHKLPIGGVNVILLCGALAAGWALGGPIGIGTLIAPFGIGSMQQLAFHLMKFDPKQVVHQDIITSGKILFGKHERKQGQSTAEKKRTQR